ncbi:MAG TPA: ATP-binding protein [Segeticoccus sp.]|uniref:sensor histidine kinase n=1 Tax=Segeticoccus sp. TaxID=2706531 RepID=UPI002D803355|nr:ATP-binding protein [Segeticoccus sp.]HET8601896.1 ATP-binding protein [Segeticoccus sp.]
MTSTVAALLGGAVGALLVLGAALALWRSERTSDCTPPTGAGASGSVADVLAVLASSGIILDADDVVINTSPPAVARGLVRGQELAHAELRELARQVRRDGEIRDSELDLPRGRLGDHTVTIRARVAPLGSSHVLLLVEDLTQAKRVEQVRRDFVENVSHELKTPVGGLALLAEALLDAREEPAAVERFARRMQADAGRLTRLVQEIVDLSRLQGRDAVRDPQPVSLEQVCVEAGQHLRPTAESRSISLVLPACTASSGDHLVWGDRDLLVTAVRNLVANGINYSPDGTRVAVGIHTAGDLAQVTVTDQGIGIVEQDQERVFERFYRVDPARSRSTGGTGLGLAIVKHICANHGGDVSVWSEPRRGSTFTIRLPVLSVADRPARAGDEIHGPATTTPSPTQSQAGT